MLIRYILTMILLLLVVNFTVYSTTNELSVFSFPIVLLDQDVPENEAPLRLARFDFSLLKDTAAFINHNHLNMMHIAAMERKHTLGMNLVVESGWMFFFSDRIGFRFGSARPVRFSPEAFSRSQQGPTRTRYQRIYNQYSERKFIDKETSKTNLPATFILSYVLFLD